MPRTFSLDVDELDPFGLFVARLAGGNAALAADAAREVKQEGLGGRLDAATLRLLHDA